MDVRRVHKVGNNSLAVTLPRRWARRVGLNAGDSVNFRDEEDASLILFRADGRNVAPARATFTAKPVSRWAVRLPRPQLPRPLVERTQ